MEGIAALAFLGLFAWTATAQETFRVKPEASSITMTLNTTHEVVHGTFPVQSGSITFDRTSSKISGSIVVHAEGVTGNSSRDKKMNKDILKGENFNTVSFAPRIYEGTIHASGASTIQVIGVFTLLGTPHEITIPMHLNIDGSNANAKAQFIVPYVKWGLKNPSFLFWKADNDVAIDLNLNGLLSR